MFVVVDYDTPAVEEKMDVDDISNLVQAIQVKGTTLESRMRSVIGAAATPKSLVAFAGLTTPPADTLMRERVTVEAGSSAARAGVDPQLKRLVDVTGEVGVDSEFVIVMGESWFYKLNEPLGPECTYHLWRTAKDGGVTSEPHRVSRRPVGLSQAGSA